MFGQQLFIHELDSHKSSSSYFVPAWAVPLPARAGKAKARSGYNVACGADVKTIELMPPLHVAVFNPPVPVTPQEPAGRELCSQSSTPSTRIKSKRPPTSATPRKHIVQINFPYLQWADTDIEPEVDTASGLVKLMRAPCAVVDEVKESDLAFGGSGIKKTKNATAAVATPGHQPVEPPAKKMKTTSDAVSTKHLRS